MHPTTLLLFLPSYTLHAKYSYKIGIIGAAIAGPVLALQILSHPTLRSLFTPILYDSSPAPLSSHQVFVGRREKNEKDHGMSIIRGPTPQTGGAAIGIGANGLFPLYELGLRDVLERENHESAGFRFWRARFPRKGIEHIPPPPICSFQNSFQM